MQMRRHGKKYLFISHIGNHFEIILKSLAEWFYFVRIFFPFSRPVPVQPEFFGLSREKNQPLPVWAEHNLSLIIQVSA